MHKCELCNIELSNELQYKQHLVGKKHKKLESVKEEREKCALRSVFVSGFKKDVFVKHIEEYFQKFGKVNKVIIDKEKNSYAIVEFDNENAVDNVINEKTHALNGKNIKVRRRVIKEFTSKIATHSEKKKELADKQRRDAIAINALLTKCKTFDEQIDKFIEYLAINEQDLDKRKQISKELFELFNKVWTNGGYKVAIFGSSTTGLACNGSDMDVTILFEEYLKKNELNQLKLPSVISKKSSSKLLKKQNSSGSSSGNNSMPSNDDEQVDSDFEIDENEQNNNEYYSESVFEEKCKDFLNLEVDEQVNILTRVIQRYGNDLQDVRRIANARTPVVRFYHEDAHVYCDVTINNYLAVENTKLVELYLSLEPHLRKLIYTIRYWSKQKGLHGSLKINSYSIIWLIVFYLQQIKRLPSVEFLQKLVPADVKPLLIHGWNCSFETNADRISSEFKCDNPTVNEFTFNDLLKGFFEYYSNFNFENFVISVRSGTPETLFSSLISKENAINLQDPFDLSHNLCANTNIKTLEQFKNECKQSNSILKYFDSPHKSNKCWGLSMLFTRKTPELQGPKSTINSCIENGIKLALKDDNTQKVTKFILNLMKDCLMFEVKEDATGDSRLHKRKRAPALNQICNQVDSLGLNCSPKRLKVNTNSEGNYVPYEPTSEGGATENTDADESIELLNKSGDNGLLESYHVKVTQNVWQGRRNVKRDLQKQPTVESDLVKLEKKTSEKLIELNKDKPNLNSIFELNFQLCFYLQKPNNESGIDDEQTNKQNSLQMKFDLMDDNKDQNVLLNFTTMIHFLDVFINNCFQTITL